jgi:hypothetical protein
MNRGSESLCKSTGYCCCYMCAEGYDGNFVGGTAEEFERYDCAKTLQNCNVIGSALAQNHFTTTISRLL